MMAAHDMLEIPNNVLFVEDDAETREQVRLHLEVMGFVVYDTPSSKEGSEIFSLHSFNLVIVHLGHAQLASLEFVRLIRAASTVPILMLTKRNEIVDEPMIMAAGADDYISIPIDFKVLNSRVNQQIRRGESQKVPRANLLTWNNLEMDLSQHSLKIDDKLVNLTNMEFQFLQLLMENPARIFSRNQILEAIGVMKGIGTDHIVDTHASRIRNKIRENGGPEVISVIRSVGFRLINPHINVNKS
jgi:two-component system response regulator VicR